MALTRDQFAENLRKGTEAVRKNIQRVCWNKVPTQDRYFIFLNSSFDGNPLASGELVFRDDDISKKYLETPRSFDEVVEKLWRDGKIPEWIDITPYEIQGNIIYYELRCCGRFATEEKFLYHKEEGYPPFHLFGPIEPVGYQGLEKNGKFDMHCYRDRKQTKSTDTDKQSLSSRPVRASWFVKIARLFKTSKAGAAPE